MVKKTIKILIGAAVVVTAGVLVWNLMWMQEEGSKYDVNQLREEARQLAGESQTLPRNVTVESERAVPLNKEESGQDIPYASEEESIEELLQENKAEAKTDVASRPEPVAGGEPEQIVQGDQDRDVDEPVEDAEILHKDTDQLKAAPNKPKVITIRGKPVSNPQTPKVITIKGGPVSNPRTETKKIYNSIPVTQYPTSTAP